MGSIGEEGGWGRGFFGLVDFSIWLCCFLLCSVGVYGLVLGLAIVLGIGVGF